MTDEGETLEIKLVDGGVIYTDQARVDFKLGCIHIGDDWQIPLAEVLSWTRPFGSPDSPRWPAHGQDA